MNKIEKIREAIKEFNPTDGQLLCVTGNVKMNSIGVDIITKPQADLVGNNKSVALLLVQWAQGDDEVLELFKNVVRIAEETKL